MTGFVATSGCQSVCCKIRRCSKVIEDWYDTYSGQWMIEHSSRSGWGCIMSQLSESNNSALRSAVPRILDDQWRFWERSDGYNCILDSVLSWGIYAQIRFCGWSAWRRIWSLVTWKASLIGQSDSLEAIPAPKRLSHAMYSFRCFLWIFACFDILSLMVSWPMPGRCRPP